MSANLQSETPCYRRMRSADLPQVLAIEEQVYDYPWTLGILSDCLRVGYYCQIIEIDTQIIAYSVMSVAVGESHLLNLSVHPDWQKRGFGRRLLNNMLEYARVKGATASFLEVRESNTRAIKLYLAQGYNQVGIRTDYYPARHGREDAIIFALQIFR